jgi:putative transposase
MRNWAAEFVEWARSGGVELTGDYGLSTALVRQVVQTGLEVEMTDHLATNPAPARVGGRATAATAATQDRDQRGWQGRPAGPRDHNSSFCASDVAQGSTSLGRPDRERDLALRQGHNDRGCPGAPGRDLRDRDLPGHHEPDHRRRHRGPPGVAEPVPGPHLPGPADRRHRGPGASTSTANATCWACEVGPTGGEGAKFWMSMLTELRNRGIHATEVQLGR